MVYGVLEELPTGIWILSPTGATVSINRYAHRICRLLLKSERWEEPVETLARADRSSSSAASVDQTLPMPSSVERLCQAVIESRDLFPERPIIIEDQVQIGSLTVHLRARWLELELDSYVLIMLESPQIHPLARVSKLVNRGASRRGQRFSRQSDFRQSDFRQSDFGPEQFLEQLGYQG